ncbi:hypothetical protein DB324_08900 [Limosilactobacillus reuteri]|nr:hypothetical protein [Limosilactobacillus reuteri]PEG78420.1 hypothetical protein CP369_10440 [Lactobacillus sp. UMNPBX18]PEG88501.1 hypothetical protein CP364_06955 [Lactobacillus sp. UMNPBX13]PEG93812.1 hypothetical protein CP361_09990 [Lactobacillus sp. UMNPBX10]PEG99899.1 hypothetical protein CP358_09680 [Lactobacillus sp. UMNPBX7]PEH07775.1 hypothetical protein CP354_07050 [Lactobacillus sp. UMNPBX3]
MDISGKNKWNIIEVLIFFIICVYCAYNKNIIASTSSLLCAILWLISCLKKQYFFLEGIAIILYAIFILIIRIDLWLGALACIVIGLFILFFYLKKLKKQ